MKTESNDASEITCLDHSFPRMRVFYVPKSLVDDSASGRIAQKAVRYQLLSPEVWLAVASLVLLGLSLLSRFTSLTTRPAIFTQLYIIPGVVFLYVGLKMLSLGLVLKRLRRDGVLRDLLLAGENPVVVLAAFKYHVLDRVGIWIFAVFAIWLVEGLLHDKALIYLLAIVIASIVTGIGLLAKHRATGKKKVVILDIFSLWTTGREGFSLYHYIIFYPIWIPLGVGYLAGAGHAALFVAGFVIWLLFGLLGRRVRHKAASLDLNSFEQRLANWFAGGHTEFPHLTETAS